MATTKQGTRRPSDEEASVPLMQPSAHGGLGHGGMDAGFVWQQLSEIQKTLGALQEGQRQHGAAIDKMEAKLGGKLSSIESDVADFKQIKHTAKVLGWIGGVAVAAFIGIAGFVAKEMWGVLKPMAAQVVQQQAPKPAPPQTK